MEKVAKISKLYGADGEAVINLMASFPDDFSLDQPLFMSVDSLMVPLYCEKFERRGRASAVVRFADLDTERRITEFMGADLHMPEADEEPNDEFYMEDLVGFAVEVDGREGRLTNYIHSEANPLFEVVIDGRESLIPAAEEFIVSIDFDNQIIRFVVPEGLLDL